MTGSKSSIVEEPLPTDDPKQRRPNIELADARLSWRPTINLRKGLRSTIDYFDKLVAKPATSVPVARAHEAVFPLEVGATS